MSRSSIFSFETLRLGRYAPLGLMTALALLAGAEVALRVAGARLGQPRLWGEGETSTKAAMFERYVREHGDADVLVLGPSHASAGFDPAALADALTDARQPRPRVFNAGLMGRDYEVSAFMLRHAWLPRAHPKLILVTVSPICLNAAWNPLGNNTSEFYLAPMPRVHHGWWLSRKWYEFLVPNVYLFRMRWREHRLDEGFIGGEKLLAADGWHALKGTLDDAARSKLKSPSHPYRGIWQNYELGGNALTALEDIVSQGRAVGAKVVLVEMPFREALFDLPGDGRAAYAKYRAQLDLWATAHDVGVLDMQKTLPLTDADFVDADHPNRQGAEKLSRSVGEDLKAAPGAGGARPS